MQGLKLTPMMEQWHKAKQQHPDAILLFRMGDFYELFGDDAIKAAPILELALTSRDKDKSGLKMAGFPFHAASGYVSKLIEHGNKVAICEQLENPRDSRGIVKRGVVNVITPGTAITIDDNKLLETAFLIGLYVSKEQNIALCALDLSTTTFKITSSMSREKIRDEILRLMPREIVIKSDDELAQDLSRDLEQALKRSQMVRIEKREYCSSEHVKSYLREISLSLTEQMAVSLVLSYIAELQGKLPYCLECPRRYSVDEQLLIDESTRINLDLFPRKKGDQHNLFTVLDQTKTAMGRRALYQSIKAPLTSIEEIQSRQNLVEELFGEHDLTKKIGECLAHCHDLEKLTALLASGRVSPRGLAYLRDTLQSIQEIGRLIDLSSAKRLKTFLPIMSDINELTEILSKALCELPPLIVREGGIFKSGYDEELDSLRLLMTNSKQMLLDLEANERKLTGISSLKIKFTRVFGYYLEVTKTHLEKVPARYQRKQTIANGERYIIKELSDLEAKMNSAEMDALLIEEKRFNELNHAILIYTKSLVLLGRKIAMLDMLISFSLRAKERAYIRPEILEPHNRIVDIQAGRHPIVEEIQGDGGFFFVPNDVLLDSDACSTMLITGPNMAGKSTIMRQVALMQIMAQMGSFVPAKKARFSLCDAIFARVGASDDLSTGRSTFMVEMTETAAILNNATATSLILLDEIGRGTSTYDGLSIAQAVIEYIHDHLKTRTLFATHYHELTKLDRKLTLLKNFHVQIEENGLGIRFLYTLGQGPCLKSFGIEVAKISGLPKVILDRAMTILAELEADDDLGQMTAPHEKITPKKSGNKPKSWQLPLSFEQLG